MTSKARENLADVCRVIDETVEVEQIYLFGSRAYDTPNADSDYYLCVVIRDGTLRPADAIKRIRRALFPMQDTPQDIIVYRESTFRQRQENASLARKIVREGVLLYERSGLEHQNGESSGGN